MGFFPRLSVVESRSLGIPKTGGLPGRRTKLREATDDAFLTDDGWLYFGLTLTDTTAAARGRISATRSRGFVSSSPCYTNCDASTNPPILNVNDFTCFLNAYAVGCP